MEPTPDDFIAYLRKRKAPPKAPDTWRKWDVFRVAPIYALDFMSDYAKGAGHIERARQAATYLRSRMTPIANIDAFSTALENDDREAAKAAYDRVFSQLTRKKRSRRRK